MLQSTLSGSSVPGLGGRERVIWRYGLVLYDYEVRLYCRPYRMYPRKIDTIRESMPGNSNSPQVPRRGPRMYQGWAVGLQLTARPRGFIWRYGLVLYDYEVRLYCRPYRMYPRENRYYP